MARSSFGAGPNHGGTGSGSPPSTAAAIAILFAIAVMAPIGEEIAFRGYLFPALTRVVVAAVVGSR